MMLTRKSMRILPWSLSLSSAGARRLPMKLRAQRANPDSSLEVIVTAQKRAERISDVPMSIAAVTGEQLDKQGVSRVSDLTRLVPGFNPTQPSDYGSPVLYNPWSGF